VLPFLPDLARLRVSVFRAYPYLYEGDEAYERDYLKVYANTPGAAVVVARDGARVVGASTCLPMAHETPNVQQPFRDAGWEISRVFYFGESVLEPEYRGRGIGVEFFVQREAAASGFATTTFCAVQRPADHKLRPANYVPLDDFWCHRGYAPRPELVCTMSWRDIGDEAKTAKPLMFWTKDL
jgi:GNAT superfamily N-acetyltransferase